MGNVAKQIEVGTRFGRLVTVAPVELRPRADGHKKAWVKLKCDCGEVRESAVDNLKSGDISSCGCLRKELVAAKMTTHGATAGVARYARPRLYRIWRGARQRCSNPEQRNYKWYGAKGVQVCPEWDSFAAFHEWALTHGYADGLELDRKDSDKDYCPVNCRWVTKKQNLRNRDMCWDEELDERLVAFAAAKGVSPYEVIADAVASYLSGGGDQEL